MTATNNFTAINIDHPDIEAIPEGMTFLGTTPAGKIYGFTIDQLQSIPGWNGTGTDILDAVSTEDLADTSGDPATGAGLVAYSNLEAEKLGGATTVQAALDAADTLFLKSTDAEPATRITSLLPTDDLHVSDAAGQTFLLNWQLLANPSSNDYYEITTTPFAVLPEHARRLGVNKVAGNAVAQFALQSAQEYLPGSQFRFLHRGGGTFGVGGSDASIQFNEASGGSVEAAARGDIIEATNVAPNDWSATGKAVAATTDTSPPTILSISPANGSTIAADTQIVVTFSESVQAGTGLITQRQSTGGGAFGDDGTIDVASPGGKMTISGAVMTLSAANARVPGDTYAYRIAGTCLTDLADTPNAFAGVNDDATIGPFTVAAAAPAEISLIDSLGFYISGASVSVPPHTRTMGATPSTGDMVVQIAVAPLAIGSALPDGTTTIYDSRSATNPASYGVYRVEGGTPSNQLSYPTVYNFRQAAAYLVVRGSGGTLSQSGSTVYASRGTADQTANAGAYTPSTEGELVVAVHAIDTKDVTPLTTALVSAGWSVPINQNTEQGSSTSGCSLVVAVKENCPAGVAVDPPALDTEAVIYRGFTFGIKETA